MCENQSIHFIKGKIASLERELQCYYDILKKLEKESIKSVLDKAGNEK